MQVTIHLNEEQSKQLQQLAQAFNLSKQQILKNLAFNCENLKKLKQKDYNLVYAELLQLNQNVSQLIEFLKDNKNEISEEALFVLYEIKNDLDELKRKV